MQNKPKPSATKQDIQENKALALISYIWILCLVPLLTKKDSAFAQYHGKQGLVLFIFWVLVNSVAIIPVLGWLIAFFGNIVGILLMVVGLIHVSNEEMKELPWIGQYADKLNL